MTSVVIFRSSRRIRGKQGSAVTSVFFAPPPVYSVWIRQEIWDRKRESTQRACSVEQGSARRGAEYS